MVCSGVRGYHSVWGGGVSNLTFYFTPLGENYSMPLEKKNIKRSDELCVTDDDIMVYIYASFIPQWQQTSSSVWTLWLLLPSPNLLSQKNKEPPFHHLPFSSI